MTTGRINQVAIFGWDTNTSLQIHAIPRLYPMSLCNLVSSKSQTHPKEYIKKRRTDPGLCSPHSPATRAWCTTQFSNTLRYIPRTELERTCNRGVYLSTTVRSSRS